MTHVLAFTDPAGVELETSGGKGSSLSRLARAGFPVPAGFIVSSDAYRRFVTANGLQEQVLGAVATIDFTSSDSVEEVTAKIRATIAAAPVPEEVAAAVLAGYRGLGADTYVAVRSSGTAEDLAEASFAGQHDSYLDIRGEADVLDAVRRCWASLWTARACAYREQKGFDHAEVRLAVVVQTMVASEVSGVMFTANPLTTSTSEIVVNASWGLGEGIVSGMLTPDMFVIDSATLAVKDRQLGSKAVRVVRNPATGSGVVHEDVPEPDRARFCLSDGQITDLAALGVKVQGFCGEWPQDIEWAFADGSLYLLQSRDVTGVDFSWDEELEDYSLLPPHADDALLTRAFSDEAWPGRKTPLFYSVRGESGQLMMDRCVDLWDLPVARWWKYHKGEVYWNSEISYGLMAKNQPKMLQDPALMLWTLPSDAERLAEEPGLTWVHLAKMVARITTIDSTYGFYKWYRVADDMMDNEGELMLGPSLEALSKLGDRELVRSLEQAMKRQEDWYVLLWNGMFLYTQWVMGAFMWMLKTYYTGTNEMIYADLITGLPRHTWALKENLALWQLAEKIRHSETLTAVFSENRDGEFFAACKDSDEGREFLAAYQEFLRIYGHRGHAERDAWYLRREEDPSIDYLNFEILLSGAADLVPGATEERLIARREAAAQEVIECIKKHPFASAKVELFKLLNDYMIKFYMLRDDERFHSDRGTYAKKKHLVEIGRRLVDRGILTNDDDFWYLSKNELYRLLDGATGNLRVVRAKIEARRRNCDEMEAGARRPMYLNGNGTQRSGVEEAGSARGEDGVLRGTGTSRGTYVGTARVISTQKEMGRVKKGEILVCFATDPGWTSVFMVAGAAIFETGGILAHCSCISREYGIPAVQIIDATRLIEDGATIEVNGDTGEVRILAPAPVAELQPA